MLGASRKQRFQAPCACLGCWVAWIVSGYGPAHWVLKGFRLVPLFGCTYKGSPSYTPKMALIIPLKGPWKRARKTKGATLVSLNPKP